MNSVLVKLLFHTFHAIYFINFLNVKTSSLTLILEMRNFLKNLLNAAQFIVKVLLLLKIRFCVFVHSDLTNYDLFCSSSDGKVSKIILLLLSAFLTQEDFFVVVRCWQSSLELT